MSKNFHRLRGSRLRAGALRLSHPLALTLALSVALLAIATVVAFGQILGTPNHGHLVAVGPTEEPDGFPNWHKHEHNLRFEPCPDAQYPLCKIVPDTPADPTQPVSFPDNLPSKFFLAAADSNMTAAGGGELVTRLALEASFAKGAPAAGDQVVFWRVRLYGGLKVGETSKITHPYGVDRFVVVEQDPGSAASVRG
jgi:hypothetical protein